MLETLLSAQECQLLLLLTVTIINPNVSLLILLWSSDNLLTI